MAYGIAELNRTDNSTIYICCGQKHEFISIFLGDQTAMVYGTESNAICALAFAILRFNFINFPLNRVL